MSRLTIPARLLATALLIATSLVVAPPRARAAAPALTVTPSTVAPHATIAVSGTGFDPSTGGQQVTVTVSLTTSAGTVTLGRLTTDGSGAIANGQLTLPFALDAGSNTLLASQDNNASLSASATLTGVALQPQLNGGQPLTAHPGDQVEVKGSGFAPNDTLSVSLNGTALNTTANQSTTSSDANGAADIQLALPGNVATGTQTLTVTGSATGNGQRDQATLALTIGAASTSFGGTPTAGGAVQITPNPAAVGTSVRASAGGFTPGEPVSFSLHFFDLSQRGDAVQNTSATADQAGNATATISIPASADGSKGGSITALGINSGKTVSGPITFAELAQLSISPPSAPPGAQITVSGSGFVPGEALFVTTRLFKPAVGRFALVDATGHFSVTTTLFGTLQPNAQLVLAVSGSGGDQASVYYTVGAPVRAAIQVSAATAPSGGTLVVTGQGFGPGEGIGFSLDGAAIAPLDQLAVADQSGAFTATVRLTPGLPARNYTLTATGAATGRGASQAITLTPALDSRWYFAEGFTGQGPKVSFHETITLLNPADQPASGSVNYSFQDGSTESLPIVLKPHALLVRDVNADVGPDKVVTALIKTDRPIVAERTVARTDARKRALDTDYSPGQQGPAATWYFAEGYSGVSFQPYLTLANPNTVPVTATVTLFPTSGAPKGVDAALTPSGRATLNLRSVLPGKSFSIKVAATGPVIAERVEYWGDGSGSAKFGAGVKPGVVTPGKRWYFGYASALAGDQAFISAVNPFSGTAHLTVQFFDGSGKIGASARVSVAAGQRATINVGAVIGKGARGPVAAILDSDAPVVAEEAQYSGGSPNTGSHPGASIEGRPAAATRWSFAAGDTRNYRETEYIFNPAHAPVYVTAHFQGADGQQVSATYLARPTSVTGFPAGAVKGLHAGAHGSVWTTNTRVPVVIVQTLVAGDGHAVLADQGLPGPP